MPKPVFTTPEYYAWNNMNGRCNNPNNSRWHRYGGRGIKICKRWRSFANFLADMGPRPKGKRGKRSLYSLERRNNDRDYKPSNCLWGTIDQQRANAQPRDWSYTRNPVYRRKMRAAANKRWRKQNAL